jgi:phage tail sheath gpL-like
MAISFNNIPNNTRTPGTYTEVDNSRANKGLFPNPQKALLIGQKLSTGSKAIETLNPITNSAEPDSFFGAGSVLARMCNVFKDENPNTDLYAIALSGGTLQASARINFSTALSHAGGSCSVGGGTLYLLANGRNTYFTITSGWSGTDIASAAKVLISEAKNYPFTASVVAASGVLVLSAVNSGIQGNYMDVRFNYFTGQSYPTCFGDSAVISGFEGGALLPDLDDAWAIIENEQYHYIGQPYIDADNLTSIENELADRFKPLEDLQGHGFTVVRGTLASCTTLGNSRNSPHNTIMGAYNSPTDPAEWAASLTAQAAFNLNQDPARPLHTIKMKNVLPPPEVDRFSQPERNTLLYDGIATSVTDTTGNQQIERCITTYQTNASGISDPSYLDVQTLATISEIRYQYKARMTTRFITPRFKLADDTFPVQPGTNVATPKTVKAEIVALFYELQTIGLIENAEEFVTNLIVERDSSDANRVNVLLPPDLINQFRLLASKLQFIL